MKLPARMMSIVNYINPGSVVADIGTDHGLIPVYLVREGLASRVIAADINQGPLDTARKNVFEAGLADHISLRLGDGLEILQPGEADTVIIAGMGGGTISGILARGQSIQISLKQLVVQPMVDSGQLREWLVSNGWKIAGEDIIKEDQRLYEVISAVRGCETSQNSLLTFIGPRLFEQKHPLLPELLTLQISKNRGIIKSMEQSRTEDSLARKEELQEKTKDLELILNACQMPNSDQFFGNGSPQKTS